MNTIAIIHTQCGPYHLARAQALTSIYPGSVDLIQLTSQERQRQWVVDAYPIPITTIADGVLESLSSTHLINRLLDHLTKTLPTVLVVAGYSHPAMRAAIKWGKHRRVPVILLSDSQYCDRPRNLLLETIKGNWIRKHCDAAFVAGASASHYLETLGFPRHKIWRGYDVVDNHHFGQASQIILQHEADERQKLGLPKNYLLYVGRFAQEKNLLRLLEAFKLYQYQTRLPPWSLVLVGGGEQEVTLKVKANQLGLQNLIWSGFKQIDELPAYYSLASALILPSVSEPWGLVVNEAMACGLPILVSERCGCVLDLVFPGINGYVFNPLDTQSLVGAIVDLTMQSQDQRIQMGKHSRQIISNYTLESWAKALTDCAQAVSRKEFEHLVKLRTL
ncbi:glycosyltransferase family 4 protein [Oscillatoria sp. FACHB-1407]|uniref:glycosyltransferase family 4 protein n=1 Tax=Oscillatoria sp. FACHB-1407 TaxID=2692847 RepID=UPI0016885BF1|nr:glycosyltransferase family 4 protein [Oscillatoria sp. FACHB-1407]MBD2459660.1 glycosyltransferase family 4 protein [Oscillatoria sp. FACHB-1407]